jgi:hypothetical protein
MDRLLLFNNSTYDYKLKTYYSNIDYNHTPSPSFCCWVDLKIDIVLNHVTWNEISWGLSAL